MLKEHLHQRILPLFSILTDTASNSPNWFNVRPSNTEPYLWFIAETSDAALLAKTERNEIVLDPFLRESERLWSDMCVVIHL